MRVRVLAMLATAFAFAACNDAQSPAGLGSAEGPTAIGAEAHFNRGGGDDHDRGKPGHDDKECRDDDHGDRHDPHSHHGFKHGRHHHHGDCDHNSSKGRHDGKDRHDCDDDDEEQPGTGSVTGSVRNNLLPASGFPVFLLTPNGATVVANTTTAGDGTYTFAGVSAGPYLVCEANPFVEEWGFLAETQPAAGPPCPSEAYAPRGFTVTVTKGGTSSGNDFANFGLE